jgi:nicotinamide mononucleotide (NMN) deamidase PncC
MAEGALRRSRAEIGVAVTGVACRKLQLGSCDPNRIFLAMPRHALDMLLDAVARRARRRR